jgi:hypothetical protein
MFQLVIDGKGVYQIANFNCVLATTVCTVLSPTLATPIF